MIRSFIKGYFLLYYIWAISQADQSPSKFSGIFRTGGQTVSQPPGYQALHPPEAQKPCCPPTSDSNP